MPWHFQPVIRAREEAEETETLIKTLDSGGVTQIKADEGSNNKRVKQVPKITNWIRGNKYVPS